MTNPNHTDTSRSGDLVERLRRTYPDYYNPARASTGMAISPASLLLVRERLFNPDGLEAADLIETQAREIERLRLDVEAQEALQVSAYRAGLKAGWNFCVDDNHEGQQAAMASIDHIKELRRIREARAALGESHD